MQKQRLNNSELDRIGKLLVKSASVRENESEIDKIVGNPELYEAVRSRIANEPGRSSVGIAFGFVRRNAVTLSVVLCISIAAFSFGLLRTKDAVVAKYSPVQPEPSASSSVSKSDKSDRFAETLPSYVDEGISPQKTSAVSRVVPVRPVPRKPTTRVPEAGEFYAVSYAGDRNEMDRGGRIIRVDMPRSALFAMGVNIPLENDAEVVKADLLVGNDGVTRAIRIVE